MTTAPLTAAQGAALTAIAHPNGRPGEPDVLRRLDLARMAAEQPPPVPYVAHPLVVRGATTLLWGLPGDGKSMLAQALTGAVARGDTVAGIDVAKGRALYVDAENGEREIWRRVHALDLDPAAVSYYAAEGFDLRRDLAALAALIDAEQPDLLVLDSLASLTPGLEEQDAAQTVPLLTALAREIHARDCGALLIHHARKAGDDYRGGTGIAGAVDASFQLGRDRDDHDHARRFLQCHKMRVAPEPPRRWLQLTADRGMVLLDQADPPDGAKQRPAPKRTALVDSIAAALTDTGQSTKALAAAGGRDAKDGTFRRALKTLAESDQAERQTDGTWTRGPRCHGATSSIERGTWHPPGAPSATAPDGTPGTRKDDQP